MIRDIFGRGRDFLGRNILGDEYDQLQCVRRRQDFIYEDPRRGTRDPFGYRDREMGRRHRVPPRVPTPPSAVPWWDDPYGPRDYHGPVVMSGALPAPRRRHRRR
jgi:hypothetical protein